MRWSSESGKKTCSQVDASTEAAGSFAVVVAIPSNGNGLAFNPTTSWLYATFEGDFLPDLAAIFDPDLIVVGGGEAGLFVGSGGMGTVVYSAPVDRLLGDPSLNASGLVAFDQADIFSDGIYLYDPESGMTAQEIPATTFDFAAGVSLTRLLQNRRS